MRKSIILVVAFGIGLLSGCAGMSGQTGAQAASYAINVGLLANEISIVDPEIAQAEALVKAHKGTFTATEWASLQKADGYIQKARDTVHEIVSSASGAQTAISLAQLQTVYSNARAAYLTAKPIIKAHASALTPLQRQQLATLDQNAQTLDSNYQAVLAGRVNGVNVTQMLQNALTLAALGAKIAVAAGA